MPLVAAAAIFAGAIEVSAVVAGLTYASAGLYAVGKITGNNTLMKLSAVTGLAAAGVGLYEGLSSASTLAGGGSSGGPVVENIMEDGASGVTSLAQEGSGAASSFGVDAPSTELLGGSAGASGAANTANSLDAVGSQINGPASDIGGIAPASTTGPADIGATAPAANNLAGNTEALQQPTGIINQAQPASADLVSAQDQAGMAANSGLQVDQGALTEMPAFKAGADPTMLGKARAWWGTLSNSEKLAASNFVAKGLGSVEDFVGPKADVIKAQAGLANANTGLINQQMANMAQPAMKIPQMAYTFTPRSGK